MGFFRSVIGGTAKSMVNVPGWMSLGYLKKDTLSMVNWLKGFFVPKKAFYKETFEQAVKRLDLTEQDLAKQQRRYFGQAVFFLLAALCLLFYTIYLFVDAKFIPGALAFLVFLLALVRTFISHFWYYQIKNRKLGCTVKEWAQGFAKEN